MKKLLIIVSLFLLCACTDREDYYVFSFDDYSLTPGYDDVNLAKIALQMDVKSELDGHEEIHDIDVYLWGLYFGDLDIYNPTDKPIETSDGFISKMTVYFGELSDLTFKIDGIELSDSIKENCTIFNGEYIERNGYACAFGKKVNHKNNVVVMYGDILAEDQDKLHHLKIYVEE